jgi:hypothetical protein
LYLEGVFAHARDELWTKVAKEVYEQFENHVNKMAGERLDVYFDIHSNSNTDTRNAIEIATIYITRQEASAIKDIFKRSLAINSAILNAPSLDVLVEPLDSIYWVAYAAKNWGILKLPEKGIHIELPLRNDYSKSWYTKLLIQALPQIITTVKKGSTPPTASYFKSLLPQLGVDVQPYLQVELMLT